MSDEQFTLEVAQAEKRLASLPEDLRERIEWGLYGGDYQYYIVGVDGTLAQMGPEWGEDWTPEKLRQWVDGADSEMTKLIQGHNKL